MANILARTSVPIDTDSSTHAVALTGANSGELILIFAASNDAVQFLTVPGFSILKNEAVRGDAWGGIFARIADGTETSINITLDGNTKTEYVVVRVGDWGGALSSILVSDQESGISTSVDPANLPITWDTVDTLFIQAALARRGNGSNDISGFSTGYANGQNYSTVSGSGGATVALADRAATVISTDSGEDPDAVTIASATSWAVYTVAIRDLNTDFGISSVSAGPYEIGDTLTLSTQNADASGKGILFGSLAVSAQTEDASATSILIPDLFDEGLMFGDFTVQLTNTSNGQTDSVVIPVTIPDGYETGTVAELTGYWTDAVFSSVQVGHTYYAQTVAGADHSIGAAPEGSTFELRVFDGSSWFVNTQITVSGADTTPTAFTFTDVTDQNLSTVVESNTVTVTDVDVATDVAISITGGEYAVSTDGGSSFGAWTSSSGNVQLNHQVKVRGTSSASYSTAVDVVLTVGGVSDTFSITTKADDVAPVITLTGDATINLVEGDTYTEQGATWTDNVDGSGAATVGGDTVDTATPGTYTVTYNYTDAAGNAATQVTRTVNVTVAPDTTAPVLSSPTATVNGAYAATGSVSTDEAGGILYVLVSTNSTETSATIKASINNQPVVSTGTQNISASGLSPETTYYIHYVQVDSSDNTSNVVSSTSFTTEAATSGGFDSWDEWMESLDAGTFTTKLRTFLQGKGYSGSTSTMLYEYLKTVSSKASHQERKKDWEEGGWN